MGSSLVWKYVIVMSFVAVALLASLVVTGGAEPMLLGIWALIVVVFGLYYYFRLFRSGPRE